MKYIKLTEDEYSALIDLKNRHKDVLWIKPDAFGIYASNDISAYCGPYLKIFKGKINNNVKLDVNESIKRKEFVLVPIKKKYARLT